MNSTTKKSSLRLEKVGECLYRNPSSRVIYALVKVRGKQKKCSLRTPCLAEARRKLLDLRRELERTDPEAGRVTVDFLCSRYLTTIGYQAPKTIRRKKDIVCRIKAHWPHIQAAKVKKSDVLAWLASFRFGAASYNLHLETVRAVFQMGVEDRLIRISPVEGILHRKRERPIRVTPTFEDFLQIVASIRSQKFTDTNGESADLVEFIGLSGLGLAETSALKWGHVNFQRKQITARRQKTGQGFVVPIFPQLLPLLERRFDAAKSANDGREPHPKTDVFSVKNPKKAVVASCQRLGLQIYSSRAFRRMFITRAIEKGVDVKTISQWQGHRDGGKLILDTYSHVRPAHSDDMAKLLR